MPSCLEEYHQCYEKVSSKEVYWKLKFILDANLFALYNQSHFIRISTGGSKSLQMGKIRIRYFVIYLMVKFRNVILSTVNYWVLFQILLHALFYIMFYSYVNSISNSTPSTTTNKTRFLFFRLTWPRLYHWQREKWSSRVNGFYSP